MDIPEPAIRVGDGPAEQRPDFLFRQRCELENLAAAHQRRVHCKKRVFGRGADQQDPPCLHIGQQNILLGAVETVDFIEKEHRPRAAVAQTFFGLIQNGRTSFTPTAAAFTVENSQWV